MSNNIYVYPVGTAKVPAIDPTGELSKMRRFIGRDAKGEIKLDKNGLPEGESVLDCPYIRQVMDQGDLTETKPVPTEKSPATEKESE